MRLLEVNPDRRPTLEEVLRHPWISNGDLRKLTSDDLVVKSLNSLKSAKLGAGGRSNPNLTHSIIEKDEQTKSVTINYSPQHHYFHERRSYFPHITSLPSSHSTPRECTPKLNTTLDNIPTVKCQNYHQNEVVTDQQRRNDECDEQKQKQQLQKKQKLNDEVLFLKGLETPALAVIIGNNMPSFSRDSCNLNLQQKLTQNQNKNEDNGNIIQNLDSSALNHRWREERALKYDEFSDTETDCLLMELSASQKMENNRNIESEFKIEKIKNNFEYEQPCSSKSLFNDNINNNDTNPVKRENFFLENFEAESTILSNENKNDVQAIIKVDMKDDFTKFSPNYTSRQLTSLCSMHSAVSTFTQQGDNIPNIAPTCRCALSARSSFQDSNVKDIDRIVCGSDQNLPSSVLFEGIKKILHF